MMAGAPKPESESKPETTEGNLADVSISFDILKDNFETLATAKGGIPKLRETILQLAVQGRLVPQNPEDEPAFVLMERIQKEKARLVKEKKIKKQKALPPVELDEVPYALPEGWIWTQIDYICSIVTDGTHKTPNYTNSGVPFLSVNNLRNNLISFDNCKYISKKEHLELISRCNPENGDILLGKVGSIGVCDIINTDYEFSIFVQLALLKPIKYSLDSYFIKYSILSNLIKDQLSNGTAGSALKYIGIGKIKAILIPLPPLAEQHRIVERVDALMTLCDELEARQDAESERRRMLLASSLNALFDATDPDGAAAAREILAANFDLLFDDRESIAELRKTILQLAVQGRLVEQNPDDEPASVLLEKIQAEKARFVKEKKIKKSKALPPVDESEVPYEVPEGWVWIKIGDISDLTSGKGFGKEEYTTTGIRLLQIANVGFGNTKWDNMAYLPVSYKFDYPRLVLNPNDIVMALNRPLLKGKLKVAKVKESDMPVILYQRVGRFDLISNVICDYFFVYLNSPLFINWINESLQGSDQPFVNKPYIMKALIPLPPLPEQHRIVERVDTLMKLCDELEKRVVAQEDAAERLLASVCDGICG